MKSIQCIVEVPIKDLQTESARKNWANYSNDQCCLCGKKVGKNSKMVHYTTDGTIISTNEDVEHSQGFFPVGNECAKKLVINFSF